MYPIKFFSFVFNREIFHHYLRWWIFCVFFFYFQAFFKARSLGVDWVYLLPLLDEKFKVAGVFELKSYFSPFSPQPPHLTRFNFHHPSHNQPQLAAANHYAAAF